MMKHWYKVLSLLRIILVLLFLIVSASRSFSQDRMQDVVYLNNGTFLRGNIINLVPEKSLTIVIGKKDTLEIPLSEVKEIKKEPVVESSGDNREYGYTVIPELTFSWGLSEGLDRYMDEPTQEYSVMLSVFNGFTITPNVQLGAGVGLDIWQYRRFLPLYLDFRFNVLKTVNTPFLFTHVGYAPGWIVGESGAGWGGATVSIGVGGKFRCSSWLKMTLALGYRYQQTRVARQTGTVEVKATEDAHLISFRVGMLF